MQGPVWIVRGRWEEQIIAVRSGPEPVSYENRLSIEQPKDSGEWNGHDLTVEHSYSKDLGQIDLSGNPRFSSALMMGYPRVEDFRLGAIFPDAGGRVLHETSLVTNRGSFDPISFKRMIELPPNAVSMAFSYQGSANESSHSERHTRFSFSPVR